MTVFLLVFYFINCIFWGVSIMQTGNWELTTFVMIAEGIIIIGVAIVEASHDIRKAIKKALKGGVSE